MAATASSPRLPRSLAIRAGAAESDLAYGAALGVVLTWVAIRANGGLRVGDNTTTEVVLDLVAGGVVAAALLAVAAARRNTPAAIAAGLFALFVVVSTASTIWSVAPDQSWLEANRLVTYLAVFASGMALVRLAPHRWTALLGGITTAAVGISIWALMHKMFPSWLEPDEIYARLREPFGYWNAVGLMAALGVPGCLWLGARREGHPLAGALAVPFTALLIVVILLSYSRGALLALLIGCAFWFAAVPLRLRGAAILAAATIGGGLVIAWVFAQDALSSDRVPLDLRDQAGHQLLIAVLFMVVVLAVAGLAIGFARERHPLRGRSRRRAGVAVVAALALFPLAGLVALTASQRGLTGSISHAFNELTDTSVGGVVNTPGRLTAVGSVRARYWNDALKIFSDRPWFGVGAGGYQTERLRYRTDTLDVLHAHGYVVQVLADRGIVGLLLSLAALIALGVAVAAATGLRRGGRALRATPERIGLLTLATMIIVFGVHSFVDWTWYVPGVAVPMLLAGGWLAGRGREHAAHAAGPLAARIRAGARSRTRMFAAAGVVGLAVAASWTALQPQRSIDATDEALAALTDGRIGTARKQALNAEQIDPLSIQPFLVQSAIEIRAGNPRGAQRALQKAVRLQPADPATWTALAEFQLHQQHDPAAAKRSLGAALYLDPRNVQAVQLLLEANRPATATP